MWDSAISSTCLRTMDVHGWQNVYSFVKGYQKDVPFQSVYRFANPCLHTTDKHTPTKPWNSRTKRANLCLLLGKMLPVPKEICAQRNGPGATFWQFSVKLLLVLESLFQALTPTHWHRQSWAYNIFLFISSTTTDIFLCSNHGLLYLVLIVNCLTMDPGITHTIRGDPIPYARHVE